MEGDKSRVKRGQLGVCCHSQGRDCVMGESVHYLPQPQSDSGNKGGKAVRHLREVALIGSERLA